MKLEIISADLLASDCAIKIDPLRIRNFKISRNITLTLTRYIFYLREIQLGHHLKTDWHAYSFSDKTAVNAIILIVRYILISYRAAVIQRTAVILIILMVQTIEKSGKHRRADSKATHTQQAVYPVATDIPPCGLNVMQKHSQGFFIQLQYNLQD